MPVICRLPGGSQGNGGGGSSDLQLNIFTQPDEPETKDGIWVQKANSHKKIVVDNLISASGEWSEISTAPLTFRTYQCRSVLFNNKILAFNNDCDLWSFDGSTWTLMYRHGDEWVDGQLAVINNTLYCVASYVALDSSGSNYGPAIFRWNGTTWSKTANLPSGNNTRIDINSVISYNNYIYIFVMTDNGSGQTTQLMRSSGSSFSTVKNINYTLHTNGYAVVFNNKIYWIGDYYTSNGSVDIDCGIITYDGSNLSLPSSNNTPFGSSGMIWSPDVFDGVIHTICYVSATNQKHYTFNGSTWTKIFDNMSAFTDSVNVCTYNTRFYAMWKNQYMYYSKSHDKYPEHTLILQIADTHDGPYETALVNTSELVTNGRFVTKFNDVFFVGESGLETTDPIYYGDGSKWVKFKN